MRKTLFVAISIMVCLIFLTGFILDKPTTDDEFSDEIVLISLNESATRGFGQYMLDDFQEIGVSSVRELTASDAEIRILSLTLKNPGKENVLNAIELLKKRPDVASAGPSYYGAIATSTETTPIHKVLVALLGILLTLIIVFILKHKSKNRTAKEECKS